MSGAQQLDAALAAVDRVDQIVIDITDAGFVWRLVSDGREFFRGEAEPDQIPAMLRATEILMRTELRAPSPELLAELN